MSRLARANGNTLGTLCLAVSHASICFHFGRHDCRGEAGIKRAGVRHCSSLAHFGAALSCPFVWAQAPLTHIQLQEVVQNILTTGPSSPGCSDHSDFSYITEPIRSRVRVSVSLARALFTSFLFFLSFWNRKHEINAGKVTIERFTSFCETEMYKLFVFSWVFYLVKKVELHNICFARVTKLWLNSFLWSFNK